MLKVEQTVVDASQTAGAETLLRVLGPIIESRVETLVRSLIAADQTELPALRGQLTEVWRILSALRDLAANKSKVNEAIQKAFNADTRQDR